MCAVAVAVPVNAAVGKKGPTLLALSQLLALASKEAASSFPVYSFVH